MVGHLQCHPHFRSTYGHQGVTQLDTFRNRFRSDVLRVFAIGGYVVHLNRGVYSMGLTGRVSLAWEVFAVSVKTVSSIHILQRSG